VRKAKLSVRVIFVLAAAMLASGARASTQDRCARLPGGRDVSVAVTVRRPLAAFRVPGHGALARFGRLNVNGVDTIFRALGSTCDGRWLHVQLPLRPNGAAGWVRADHVRLSTVRTRIVVDLSERALRFYRRGKLVLRSSTAVGSSATPTPTGRYYVSQRLIPPAPGGPFGPGAIGISAFSPVLTGWAQGGPVAIHGTNEPWSIGRAVSNGCIRLPNGVDRRLFWQAREGTPVIIEP